MKKSLDAGGASCGTLRRRGQGRGFEGDSPCNADRDFNLDDDRCKNGWGRSHPVFGAAWFHSDMKDMAYAYVYKLYDDVVKEKGHLQ